VTVSTAVRKAEEEVIRRQEGKVSVHPKPIVVGGGGVLARMDRNRCSEE